MKHEKNQMPRMRGTRNRVALRLSQRSEGRKVGNGQGEGADIGASARGGNGALEETPIFIYALAHPQTAEVHYVGKSYQPRKRLAQHALTSLKDPRKRRWIRGLIAAVILPDRIKLTEKVKALRAEAEEIEKLIGGAK